MSRPGILDYSLLLLLSAIFGSSFMLIAVALEFFGPVTIVAARVGLAAVIMLLVMKLKDQRMPPLGPVWLMIIASAMIGNALPFLLISWGQVKVEAGLAGILMALMPLMTIFLADRFTSDEKLNGYKLAGVLSGLVGVVVLFGFDKLFSLGEQAIRQYAILAAAACYAVNVLLMKKLTGLPRYGMIAALLLVSTIVMVPLSLTLEKPLDVSPSANSVAALIVLGVIATAGGNILRFLIINRQGVTFLSQINTFLPVFAAFWAWLFIGEILPPKAFLAMAFIMAGVAIARLANRDLPVQAKELKR